MWFSRAGNGTSPPAHQQRFGIRAQLALPEKMKRIAP
jgi:hypothetical protein